MAKLTVSDGFSFDPGDFIDYVGGLDGAIVVKHQTDLWRVSYESDGEVFVRGHDFDYNSDDDLISGGISSFSFNEGGSGPGEYGPPLVRIRGLDDLSAADVHDAIESSDSNAIFKVFREALDGDDVLKGGDQGDYLIGFHGNDKIKGHGGEDFLIGGSGKDRVDGGGGGDIIIGGSGKDTLYGGGGADRDVFLFANGDSGQDAGSADKIFEFHSGGEDVIDLSETGGNKSILDIDHHDGNSYITLAAHDGHDQMVIVVMDNDQVTKSDITFQSSL